MRRFITLVLVMTLGTSCYSRNATTLYGLGTATTLVVGAAFLQAEPEGEGGGGPMPTGA